MKQNKDACPKCEREWPHTPYSEQAACIELYGECIVCKNATDINWDELKLLVESHND